MTAEHRLDQWIRGRVGLNERSGDFPTDVVPASELTGNQVVSSEKEMPPFLRENLNILEEFYGPELLTLMGRSNDAFLEKNLPQHIYALRPNLPPLNPLQLGGITCQKNLPFSLYLTPGVNIICTDQFHPAFDLIALSILAHKRFVRQLPPEGAPDPFEVSAQWVTAGQRFIIQREQDLEKIKINGEQFANQTKAQFRVAQIINSYNLKREIPWFGINAFSNFECLDMENLETEEFPFYLPEKLKFFLYGTQEHRRQLLKFHLLEGQYEWASQQLRNFESRITTQQSTIDGLTRELNEAERDINRNKRMIREFGDNTPEELDALEHQLLEKLSILKEQLARFRSIPSQVIIENPIQIELRRIRQRRHQIEDDLENARIILQRLAQKRDSLSRALRSIELNPRKARKCLICMAVIPEVVATGRNAEHKCPICGQDPSDLGERKQLKVDLAHKITLNGQERTKVASHIHQLEVDLEDTTSQIKVLEARLAPVEVSTNIPQGEVNADALLDEIERINTRISNLRNDRLCQRYIREANKIMSEVQQKLGACDQPRDDLVNAKAQFVKIKELLSVRTKGTLIALKEDFKNYEFVLAKDLEQSMKTIIPEAFKQEVPANILPQVQFSVIRQRILRPNTIEDAAGILCYLLSLLDLSLTGKLATPHFLIIKGISLDQLRAITPVLERFEAVHGQNFQIGIFWEGECPDFIRHEWIRKIQDEGIGKFAVPVR